jgi:hypothetical protein
MNLPVPAGQDLKNGRHSITPQLNLNSDRLFISKGRERPGPLTVANARKREIPLQKLLFSATLSQDPEKLDQGQRFLKAAICLTMFALLVMTEWCSRKYLIFNAPAVLFILLVSSKKNIF